MINIPFSAIHCCRYFFLSQLEFNFLFGVCARYSTCMLTVIFRDRRLHLGSRDGAVVSARLLPMCLGFHSRTRRHMWVKFVVGSLVCSERFSPGTPVFPSPQKPTFPNSNSILECTDIFERVPWCSLGKQITFNFYAVRAVTCRLKNC